MRHGRRDSNHVAIRTALRAAGRLVIDLGDVGRDVPDLLVLSAGGSRRLVLLEVKAPKGVLSDGQKALREKWPVTVARTIDDALAATGSLPPPMVLRNDRSQNE